MEKFGTRFKEERKRKKLTQEQLANMFFLNKSSISRYEKGNQMPEMPTLQKIADFFEVSTDYLLGRTDERNPISKLDEGIKTISAYKINPHEDVSEEGINKINEYIEMVRMMEKNKDK